MFSLIPVWFIYALASGIFAGSIAIFAKLGEHSTFDSTLAATLRSVIMTIFLCLLCLVSGKWRAYEPMSNSQFFFLVLSALAGASSWLCYFLAIAKGTAHNVPMITAIDRLSLVWVWIFTMIFFGMPFTFMSALGAMLMGVGAICMGLA